MMLLYASDDYHKIPYRTKIIESADNLKSYVRTVRIHGWMEIQKISRISPRENKLKRLT